MFVLVVGCGRVGSAIAKSMLAEGHEVSVLDEDPEAIALLNKGQTESWEDLEHSVHYGDGSELWVLERAGIERADLVIAVTGDDEDNILISQVAREKYGVERIVAPCNNPRNLQHFELPGIQPAVSATDLILRLIEHEVPRYGFLHLLDLPQERLEIIEIEVAEGSPAAGPVGKGLGLPDGSLAIAILRHGTGFVPLADSVIEAGDEVLIVLDTGLEAKITERLRPQPEAARWP